MYVYCQCHNVITIKWVSTLPTYFANNVYPVPEMRRCNVKP